MRPPIIYLEIRGDKVVVRPARRTRDPLVFAVLPEELVFPNPGGPELEWLRREILRIRQKRSHAVAVFDGHAFRPMKRRWAGEKGVFYVEVHPEELVP